MYAWGHAVCSTVIKVLQVNRSGQADYSALVKEEWAVSKELAAAQIAAEKADEAVASIRRQQAAVAKLRNDIKSARHAVATTLDIGGSGNKVRSNSKSSKRQGGNSATANAITTGAGASQAVVAPVAAMAQQHTKWRLQVKTGQQPMQLQRKQVLTRQRSSSQSAMAQQDWMQL
jgi:hypothetical protein